MQTMYIIHYWIFLIRPLFVGIMFFIRTFQKWYAGGRVITIIHYTL